MNLEVSTVNLALGTIIALQGWLLVELVNVKSSVAAIKEHCRLCGPERGKKET